MNVWLYIGIERLPVKGTGAVKEVTCQMPKLRTCQIQIGRTCDTVALDNMTG